MTKLCLNLKIISNYKHEIPITSLDYNSDIIMKEFKEINKILERIENQLKDCVKKNS